MSVKIIPAYDFPEEIHTLFAEYTKFLIKNDEEFAKYLQIQNYNAELQNLNAKYGLPDGRLYLAYYDNELAGCIGLKKIDTDNCEMKRLYVRPQFRSKHIGRMLAEKSLMTPKKSVINICFSIHCHFCKMLYSCTKNSASMKQIATMTVL